MKLTHLIEFLSSITGIPFGTVRLKARLLRLQRMLSTGGRGKAGAEMTPHDIATMLLALIAPGETTDVVSSVAQFAGAEFKSAEWHDVGQIARFMANAESNAVPPFASYRGGVSPALVGCDTAISALATLLPIIAAPANPLRIEALETEMDDEGGKVIIVFSDKMTYGDASWHLKADDAATVQEAFGAETISDWQITVTFEFERESPIKIRHKITMDHSLVHRIAVATLPLSEKE